MRLFLLWACWLLAPLALAVETRYRIDGAHTYAEFAVVHMGVSTVRGKLNGISGTIALDPEAGKGHMEITLDADAILTGDATVDRVLRGGEFFNTEQFPNLRFVGEKFSFADGQLREVAGRLTLLGVTKPVTLTIERTGCAKNLFTGFREVCGGDAVTTVRRSEFGMTRYAALIGDEVKVSIAVEASIEGAKNE